MRTRSLALFLLVPACAAPARSRAPAEALEAIRADDLHADIRALADDRMEGRGTGSRGEELATGYLADAFVRAGLEPAGDDGTYFQRVPLVGITADAKTALRVEGKGEPISLAYGKDFMAWTKRQVPSVEAAGDLLFVGYGTVAPEFAWDDYKGADCRGKVLVILVNDPPLADEKRFGGKAMTYYGRWTYKFEIGAEKGAAGALLIHETKAAAYPWEVVESSWSGEQFDMVREDLGGSRMPFEAWITHETAEAIFRRAGLDLGEMERNAAREDFRPVPLGLRASLAIRNEMRRVESRNVLGLLRGSDPRRRDEVVAYCAHWDHLGMRPEAEGDRVFNGAVDNATGTAGLLALAGAFARSPRRPSRSILFLATTAEEEGLLGSAYYAAHPKIPLERTVAVINMDAMNVRGRTKDVVVIGFGNSTLDDDVRAVAASRGRTVSPDAEPEKGYFYRSDHFSFAKKGVPALYTDDGIEVVGKPAGWGLEQKQKYTAERYHKPSDEYDPNWDLSGLAEDLRLLFEVGWRVSEAEGIPEWKPGTEFKALREESLRKWKAGGRATTAP